MEPLHRRAFDHVVIVIFENEYRSYVCRNPYMRQLAAQGIDLATYFGVMHPSNPNYVASVAGEICNTTKDPLYNTLLPCGPPVKIPSPSEQTTIVDRIREKGLDWRAYMESYQPVAFPPGVDMITEEEDSASLTVVITEGASGDGATITSTAQADSDVPPLVAIKMSAPGTVTSGADITFAITVSNGASFAFNVVVDAPTPAPLTLLSINGNEALTFPFTIPMLYPTQPTTLNATYSTPATFSGSVTNVATVSAVNQSATVRKIILDYPPYLNMHNPFVRFRSILENREQWQRIGTAYDFLAHASSGTLPEYSWVTPDIWGLGHWIWGTYVEADERGMVLVDQLASWLKSFFEVLHFPGPDSLLPPRTLVVVTFDEADFDVSWETLEESEGTYDGPNQIYTVLLGDVVEPDRIEAEGYNHYSLLKTIEKNFDLGNLGKNDEEANWFQFLWDRRFRWKAPSATPIAATRFVAAAGLGETLYVVYGDPSGVACRRFEGGRWSEETTVPAPPGTTAIEMAACGDELVLICQVGNALSMLSYTTSGGWSAAQSIVEDSGSFALAVFLDYGDRTEKVMLAFQSSANEIHAQTFSNGIWGSPVDVGQQTDGDLALGVLGPSLYIIHKEVGSDAMSYVSSNTAPFNCVTAEDGDDNTTQYVWSPSEFPVAHFGYAPSRDTPGNPEPLLHPYQGLAPFAAATLDGVIHLAHPGINGLGVLTETFSLSGILTAANAISYQPSSVGMSNGYGTLAQAGWTRQLPIVGVNSVAGGAMGMARFGSRLALLFQPSEGGALQMSVGAYSHAE